MNTSTARLAVNRPTRPVALHEHVKRNLSDAILGGQWEAGTLLPSESVLAAHFCVAVGTLRRALADLVAEGLLARRRRTGTIVTGRSPNHSLRFFFRYFRLHGADGRMLHSEARVLTLTRAQASEPDAARLGLAPGAPIVSIHRLRSIAGAPVMHERLQMPADRLPDFPLDAGDVPPLLYLHLKEHYGIQVTAVRETLTATLATALDRRLLDLPRQSAVLLIDEVAFDQHGNPIILAAHVATTHKHVYINEVR